ncbi:hypothetical protein [Sulfitobacter sp. R18_1]|uniref:hypothetical protein n=1 Tax=Sulfitobacter sp. R18_1 TaxID=2821104 RepID=UPI001ADBDE09|nr:hypothetical protein [Sulfitobacter sp. R18_1]MBO9428389.1 hypothetical protein [Sulfitobacter sp. R18_1]
MDIVNYKPYAGIGSRDLPSHIFDIMVLIGRMMAEDGWTLRSGHAKGADIAFEMGCDEAGGRKEIFLPKKGFNGSKAEFTPLGQEYYELAGRYYDIDQGDAPWPRASDNPKWRHLPDWSTMFHARNTQQIFGKNLDSRTDTVVCYTPEGKWKGGTAMALRLIEEARAAGDAMVFNLGEERYSGMRAEDIFECIIDRRYPAERQMSLL